ncbi:hypothetical protein PGTUg99_010404 [Puccinia graminis f. sp. tritici]|uniref:Uncharacterized protein n=1 Tax=Puccinia graminis f. sp. tritici TaxID=56615 RepID=A0A5B0SCY9_PUCGR|nr:hypothetical protein PGTUg99_010404 [Puccinia graminis f. sp. tritici]
MLDHETRPNSVTDLIIELLNSIPRRYRRISTDIDDEESERPWDIDDDAVWLHANWRYARGEALSIGEIDNLNGLLLQMQNSYLPSLQQQLGDLLESLNLDDLPGRFPNPKLPDVLEILFRLVHTVDQINHFVQSIAPIVVDPLHSYKKNDRDYGGLKVYRATELIDEMNDLMHQHVQTLFNHLARFIRALPKNPLISSYVESELTLHSSNLINAATAQTLRAIDRLIEWSKKSDFSILQDDCRRFAIKLDPILEDLISRIIVKPRIEKLLEFESDDQAEPANEHEDIRSDIDSNDHHQDNRSSTSHLTDAYEWDIPLSVQVIRLVKAPRSFIKILRIFFNKLSDTPISKAPFTIGTQLCSDEITSIDHEIKCLDNGFQVFLKVIYEIDENPMQMAKVIHLGILHDNLCRRFDSSIALLSFHLIPLSETQYDLPKSVNLCKMWFLTLREHFCMASESFNSAINRVKCAIEV